MSINEYFDEITKEQLYKVQIIRKSAGSKQIARRRAEGIKTKQEAAKLEKRFITECERELFHRKDEEVKWAVLVDDYELAMRSGDVFARQLAKATQSHYVYLLRQYTLEWNDLRIDEIDRYRAWTLLENVENENGLAKREYLYSAIKGLFDWAVLSGKFKTTKLCPVEGYKSRKRKEEKMPEILTLSEIRKLLKTAREIDHAWYPVWALALYTGMRSGELYALEWDKVDFDNSLIYVHQAWTNKTGIGPTKGRYWRTVPLNQELIKFLKELKLKTGSQKEVLPRFWQWDDGRQAEVLRSFCVGHGLTSIKFHTLRACFGTQLIKEGVAPAIVMKICGWKDLKTMQRYIRLAGVEVAGATDKLKLNLDEEVTGTVINLFNS